MKRKIFRGRYIIDETIERRLYRIISKIFIPNDKAQEKLSEAMNKRRGGRP